MNAIEDTPASRGWANIAARFPKPNAIVVISAHWVTEGVCVTSNAHPRTIHDFGRGFPQQLFDVQYPAPGEPDLARDIVARLSAFGAQLDDSWGLDHGAWSVLVHMYPEADIPVVQVSLDARRGSEQHIEIARALSPLRDDNILVLATGNIVHNLRAFFSGDGKPEPWARAFEDAVRGAVYANDDLALVHYKDQPGAAQAAPDWDHFTPLLYALGARSDDEHAQLFNQELMSGISMTSVAFGLPA